MFIAQAMLKLEKPSEREVAISIKTEGTQTETGLVTPTSALKRSAPTSISEAESASKRARRDLAEVTRHGKYWAEDGNVIVQVGTVQYKLHRSRLVAQSSFLAESLPEDAASIVINMEDVKSEDFEALLDAIEDGITYHFETPNFQFLAAVLRASVALRFTKYSTWAQKCIVNMWPSDLDTVQTEPIPHAAAAIQLARKYNMPQVRKRAMYELLRRTAFGMGVLGEPELTRSDLRRLVRARERLAPRWINAVAGLLFCGTCFRGREIKASGDNFAKNTGCQKCAQRVKDEQERLEQVWKAMDRWLAEDD